MPPDPRSTPLRLAPFAAAAFAVAALTAPAAFRAQSGDEGRLLDPAMHHLGDNPTPKWDEAPAEPSPPPLTIGFDSEQNEREWTLELQARDVDGDWALDLNGEELARIKKANDVIALSRYAVPAGRIRRGRNELTVRAISDKNDDLTIGRIRLHERSLREIHRLGRIDVRVVDAGTGRAIPARVTVADPAGGLADLYYAEAATTAVRPGIAYTANGAAAIEVPEGRFTVWASRGMEWSCASATLDVAFGERRSIELSIEREVDTTGWIACDTHIHTLTHSGHGDSSVEERVVTIAGEGVELAIATDHNHQTDYRPQQEAIGLSRWFTPVVGNEVTSENGHMNAFPLPPGTDVPPWKETDWSKLVAGIRAKGAQVVILNHPRWPEGGKDPLTKFGFDERTGANAAGQSFTFDCIELVNSDAPTQPPRAVLPAWYALLNRGERFTGVGSSDSHHVGVVVGQGRTYVPSRTDDPARIDVDDACRQFREGRVTVSLGMLATLEVAGRGMGETVRIEGDSFEASVDVRHPSWVTPERVDLVVDGEVVASAPLSAAPGDSATRRSRTLSAPLPDRDCWVVAVACGAKVTAPFWAMSQPEALAITNPVFVDRDGRAGWTRAKDGIRFPSERH